MPATYTETSSGTRTRHHKLKKAWLERHVWAEYLKAAGVHIDQNSTHYFSQMDDTPPVLQCEITKKRNAGHSETEKRVRPIKSVIKRRRKPQVIVSIPLKKIKI